MLDWNDLRFFLAVARTGSTLAAGRALKVSQTTVARRISALEADLGLILFDRRQAGYALNDVGAALLASAESVEAAAGAFADAAASQSRDLNGAVRLTTMEIYAVTVLAPILRDLHAAFPDIVIELDTSEEVRDLAGGAADIALRYSHEPSGGGLVGRRLADDPWTVYCSRDYAAAHPRPHRAADLRAHVFIGGGGAGVWPPYRTWLQRHGLEDMVVMHQSSSTGLLAAVRAGVGLAVLPSFIADRDPGLVRCVAPAAGDAGGLWLLTHERIRHTPRVRAVLDFLADRFRDLARQQPIPTDGLWAQSEDSAPPLRAT